MAADFLQLDVRQAPPGQLSQWLATRLRDAIADGRLPVGNRLPASRVLAAELGVSRGVVTEAYRRLGEDGHVAGRGRAGTVVVAAPVGVTTAPAPATAAPATGTSTPVGVTAAPAAGTTTAAARTTAPAGATATPGQRRYEFPGAGELFVPGEPGAGVYDALRAAPARIDLSPGLPDLASFPRAAWLRAERAVLASLPASALGYGDPRGTPELRRAVTDWLARNRGVRADPAELLIVSGTAQALGLVARVLRADGVTELAVEDPGSLGARQHLRAGGLDTPPVPVDAEGVRVDALDATGARAVLVTPAHQFPMGVVLGGERRRALMRWAAERDGLVVEDDYDAEHRYDRPPVPALRAMLPDRVIYAGSVSKLLAPALRIGWVLAPPKYRDALVDAKRFMDLGSAALPQLVLARLMGTGALERHLRLLRGRHRQRRDAMIASIGRHLPGAVVHGAAAGLHLTVTFPPRGGGPGTAPGPAGPGTPPPEPAGPVDTRLAAAALARGVKTHPLSWHAQLPCPPGLVMGYAAGGPGTVADGVRIIGGAIGRPPGGR
ncbi:MULTISPECIES: PLP-dependent aminotransferase family protein [Streptomyces]|uniref:aminotransferase-like domain-containing protein n=1 Tax=Streptomyces TaxID=1883 RepID=UPI0007CD57D6|nr:GntR family transcriptional regulator [Streptomyces noursei]